MSTVTADDILNAIRRKYNSAAVVSEVVLTDEHELAILRREWLDRLPPPRREREEAKLLAAGKPVAECVPDVWDSMGSKTIRRIDGLMLEGGKFTSIEIKISRADFKRDTEEKRRAWRDVTHRFVYAVPKGLLLPSEVPDYAGLWEFEPDVHWRSQITSAKRATVNKNPAPMPQQIITAMFYRAAKAELAKVGRARGARRR